jgi:hypothetical protein
MKQADALDILKLGFNVFLTGPAGSGKTFLLNKYIDYLKKNDIKVAVTASTGIAATHLNGRTIHSWCGMGISQELNNSQMNSLKDNEYLSSRILSTKVLIIDEVSMLSAKVLDLVNSILQAFKQNLKPFGGMQVILCGDFFQLPPIKKNNNEDNNFVVKSDIWKKMNLKVCYLDEQYRQDDRDFLKVLNNIRNDNVDEETIKVLESRYDKAIDEKIRPTKLYTHNINVNSENIFELNKLSGEEKNFQMSSEGPAKLVTSLKKNYCLAPEMLKLKIGAVVMFVKNNFKKHYANGTLGKVVDFDEDNGYPVVLTLKGEEIIAEPEKWSIEDNDVPIASVMQVPLKLAWALTIHKSQGMSLDCAEIDLSKTFEFGMGYVALSRVKSLQGIKLLGFNPNSLEVNKKTIDLDKELFAQSARDLNKHRKLSKKQLRQKQKNFIEISKKEETDSLFDMEGLEI